MKKGFLKYLDSHLSCLVSYIHAPDLNSSICPDSILFIRPGGIGDAVLLISTIELFKKSYPECHITVLAERRNVAVFMLLPYLDKVLCYDRPHEFVQVLRSCFDVVIDTEQWYRMSAVVARLIRAPIKIGFDTNERRRMFTHRIRYDQSAYEQDNFYSLLKPLGVNCHNIKRAATLTLPDQSVLNANQLLQPFCFYKFVVILTSTSIPEKRWGTERFGLVARRLAEDGYKVVVVGGREDRSEGDVIAGAGGLNLAGKTTLAETAAVIARSSLLISGDSGVLHLALGLGIPTVSLFGPSNVAKWAPQGKNHIVLSNILACSPCSRFGTTPPCPYNVRCMKEITADQVVEAAVILLQKFKS